jgi:biopolymer transport protein ExbD
MLARLLTCSLLAIASTVYHAMAETSPPVVELAILADGSLQVEGETYSTRPAIDAEIERLSKREPEPEARFKVDKHATYDAVAYILAQIQRTGAVKVGIVSTQPQEH